MTELNSLFSYHPFKTYLVGGHLLPWKRVQQTCNFSSLNKQFYTHFWSQTHSGYNDENVQRGLSVEASNLPKVGTVFGRKLAVGKGLPHCAPSSLSASPLPYSLSIVGDSPECKDRGGEGMIVHEIWFQALGCPHLVGSGR